MAVMTREDITEILGSTLDQSTIIEILGVGATKAELEEAIAWLSADDAMTRSAHHQPHGCIAELCEILSRSNEDLNRE